MAATHREALDQIGADGTATFLLGGEIRGGGPPDILLVYPEGNYIRASDDRPFLQIGESKYGKFTLELGVAAHVNLATATKLALTSMVSTAGANLSVGPPYDLVIYRDGSVRTVPGPDQRRLAVPDPARGRLGEVPVRGHRRAAGHRGRRPGDVTSPGAGDGSRFPFDPIGGLLGRIRDEFVGDDDGAVADYIPQLATADPTDFGLALVGVAGSLYEAGESDVPFTIQSVSKPFVYALALADVGTEEVLARVGVEPSGEGFNAISLEPGTGRPDNPLINAGAILTTSLVAGSGPEERSARILDLLSRCAGRPLTVDEAVYRSEHDTGDRNRALAHLMRAAGSLTMPVGGRRGRLLPAVLGARDRRRPGRHGRHAGQRRGQSAHAATG